jgi:transcriptional regulator with XRE-family HTH domain
MRAEGAGAGLRPRGGESRVGDERRPAQLRAVAVEIGEQLRAARERRGETLADVEASTHIRAAYLEALEEGYPERLPAEVYARGFLRSYAAHLGLDGDALLAGYRVAPAAPEAVPPPLAPPAAPASPSPARSRARGGPGRRRRAPPPARLAGTIVAGLLLIAAVGTAGWIGFSLSGRLLAHHPRAAGKTPSTASPHRARALAQGGTATAGGGRATTNPSSSAPRPLRTTPTAAAGSVGPLEGTAVHTVNGWVTTYVAPGAGPLRVQVTATGRCWIRRWVDGSSTYHDVLLPAGTSVVWTAAQSLRLELGNTYVQLRVDGRATSALPPQGPHNPEWVNVRAAAASSGGDGSATGSSGSSSSSSGSSSSGGSSSSSGSSASGSSSTGSSGSSTARG